MTATSEGTAPPVASAGAEATPPDASVDLVAAATLLDGFLRSFMRGEFSSAHLSWNDDSATNYQSVQQCEDGGSAHGDWISDKERAKGCATNSKWTFQWYPDTPVGFFDLSASTLPALVAALMEARADGQV